MEFSEARRQHLEFVQATINRMASASAVAKGWCLTIISAALGFAVVERSRAVTLVGAFAVLMFASLDARYLREERKFRCLYDGARRADVELFSMDAGAYADDARCSWGAVLKSWSMWAFYAPLLGAVAFAGARAFFR